MAEQVSAPLRVVNKWVTLMASKEQPPLLVGWEKRLACGLLLILKAISNIIEHLNCSTWCAMYSLLDWPTLGWEAFSSGEPAVQLTMKGAIPLQ